MSSVDCLFVVVALTVDLPDHQSRLGRKLSSDKLRLMSPVDCLFVLGVLTVNLVDYQLRLCPVLIRGLRSVLEVL